MLRTHLVTAVRSLRQHPGYTAINAGGLAVGIAACLLIALFVRHELSYDRFHEDADRIHRIVGDYGETVMPAAPWPVIREIRQRNPSLTVAPFFEADAVVGHGAKRVNEDQIFVAQPSFFEVFTFPVRRGAAQAAFERPYTAVLTPAKARQYFGEANPVGQTLEMTGLRGDTTITVTVAGVLEPIPDASHVHPEILVSWATYDAAFDFSEQMRDNWSGGAFRAYLKVPAGTAPAALAERFTRQANERAGPEWTETVPFRLQPLTDIHLYSDLSLEIEPNGSAAYVYLFGIVALVILVLAGVNFVNLALARSVERTQEVGVRKSIGATRGQIARQFLVEALVLAGAALVGAVGLAAGGLPLLRSVTGMAVDTGVFAEPFTIAVLLGITLVAALGSAAYPAFVVSRHAPARVLDGGTAGTTDGGGRRGARLRRGLVVFQFVVAVALGAGAIAAYWQLDHLRTTDLGFDEEQVVTVPMPPAAASDSRSRAFRRAVTNQPGVQAASTASEAVPAALPRNADFAFAGTGPQDENLHSLRLVTVGPDFFETMGIETVAGRTFSPDRPADSAAVVLNRAALERLAPDLPPDERAPAAAVGRALTQSVFWLSERPTLIGVVEDAHLAPLYESVAPTAFLLTPAALNDTYYLRLEAGAADPALARAETVWQDLFPDAPFAYEFVDQAFAAAHRAERQTGTLIGGFAGLALAIACLGLFGLAAVTARQRRREIGVRKALGASTGQIVALLTRDFARLVGVAVAVAVPLAYVGLSRWLDTFATRIALGPSLFVLAGGGTLLAALLAVGLQALRAARTDPAATLRDE
jgi:putative ABC transport system permease protein